MTPIIGLLTKSEVFNKLAEPDKKTWSRFFFLLIFGRPESRQAAAEIDDPG